MVTSMLEKAIEIEGLLRIIRDGNPLPETYKLLTAKAESLAAESAELTAEMESQKPEEPEEATKAEDSMADFVMATPTPAPAQPEVVFTAQAGAVTEQPLIIQKDDPADFSGTAHELTEIDLDLSEEDDIILSFDDVPEEKESDENTPAILPDPQLKTTDDTETPKRHSRLKPAFSLNDRFLYARELFNGNMKIFDSTLERLEGFEDFPAIEGYLYGDLGWNADDANVAGFLEILRKQFKEL